MLRLILTSGLRLHAERAGVDDAVGSFFSSRRRLAWKGIGVFRARGRFK